MESEKRNQETEEKCRGGVVHLHRETEGGASKVPSDFARPQDSNLSLQSFAPTLIRPPLVDGRTGHPDQSRCAL